MLKGGGDEGIAIATGLKKAREYYSIERNNFVTSS